MKFENIIHRSIFREYQAWPGEEGVRGSIYHSASIHDPHFSISIVFPVDKVALKKDEGEG